MRTTVSIDEAPQHLDMPLLDGGASGGLRAGIEPTSNRASYTALDDRGVDAT